MSCTGNVPGRRVMRVASKHPRERVREESCVLIRSCRRVLTHFTDCVNLLPCAKKSAERGAKKKCRCECGEWWRVEVARVLARRDTGDLESGVSGEDVGQGERQTYLS